MSHQQQLLLKQNLTVPQILRVYGKQFRQITCRYSDGHNGKCVIDMIMSYFGWNGKVDSEAGKKLMKTMNELTQTGISKNFVLQLNDSGISFDEIANYLDKIGGNKFW